VLKSKAFLVAIEYANESEAWTSADSLNELKELALTAKLEVVGSMIQKKDHPDEKYYLGIGKLTELQTIIKENQIEVLITDDELLPSQEKNLEKFLEIKVIDRTALILDIFAARAHTHEAQLQVELAQLNYLMPRLTRMWTHLSRLGGGIGTRGPGEKQLEVDKRRINERITHLKKELKKVTQSRKLHRDRRQDLPILTVCLVGYTNAGKSTLMNQLTKADVLVEDKLFATLDPTTRRLALPNNDTILITDTVGFIKKLPHQLVNAFHSTLEEVFFSDLLLHVVDVSHPKFPAFIETANNIMEELKVAGKSTILVLNKVDRVDYKTIEPLIKQNDDYIFISALKDISIDELLRRIMLKLKRFYSIFDYKISYNKQAVLDLLYKHSRIISLDYKEDFIQAKVEIHRILGEKIMGQLL
jgi:GTP-binding protein HflX